MDTCQRHQVLQLLGAHFVTDWLYGSAQIIYDALLSLTKSEHIYIHQPNMARLAGSDEPTNDAIRAYLDEKAAQ